MPMKSPTFFESDTATTSSMCGFWEVEEKSIDCEVLPAAKSVYVFFQPAGVFSLARPYLSAMCHGDKVNMIKRKLNGEPGKGMKKILTKLAILDQVLFRDCNG